jgi:hypothetical protein
MTELTQRSETSEQQPPNDDAAVSPRERLAALLNEGESHDEGNAGESQQNAEPKAGESKGKPKLLKDLAERLSVSDADLYDVEVPMPNGKAVKLGALKDAHANADDFTVRELAFEERVAKQEAEWTRGQTELQELLGQLDPKAIKPELREKVRQKVEASLKQERELTLKTIPEWQNETVRVADLGAMVEYLKDFGIHESFLTATMNHKLFRLVRSATLQKQRIEKALAKVEVVKKPSTTGKSAAGNGAAKKLDIKPQAHGRVTARDRLNQALNLNSR